MQALFIIIAGRRRTQKIARPAVLDDDACIQCPLEFYPTGVAARFASLSSYAARTSFSDLVASAARHEIRFTFKDKNGLSKDDFMRESAEWGKWKVLLPSTIHLNGPSIADSSNEAVTGSPYQIAVGQSFLNSGAARKVPSFGVDVFPVPVDGIRRTSRPPIGKAVKRAVDVVISSIALIAAAPLFLAIALLIKITTGGPVFYSHPRVGFQGRKFGCLKFRTMIETSETALLALLENDPVSLSEWRVTRKLRRDPRVTPLGHILRKLSLDELPQFINVLRGDMSCVGPRPVVEEELEKYGMSAASYKSTRPGLTGLWQVSGRSRTTYKRRVALDRYYATHWSLMLDISILLRTIPAVLRYEDAV